MQEVWCGKKNSGSLVWYVKGKSYWRRWGSFPPLPELYSIPQPRGTARPRSSFHLREICMQRLAECEDHIQRAFIFPPSARGDSHSIGEAEMWKYDRKRGDRMPLLRLRYSPSSRPRGGRNSSLFAVWRPQWKILQVLRNSGWTSYLNQRLEWEPNG